MTKQRFQTFNWMRGVADDKRISIIYRLVLLRLCIHRGEKNGGQCNPGYQTVAQELGVYRTTVLKAIDVAVRFGWLAPPIRTRRANANFAFLFPDQEVASGATSRADQEVAQSSDFLSDQEVAPSELRSRSQRVKKSLAERGSPAASRTSRRNGQRERAKKNGQKSKSLSRSALASETHSPEDASRGVERERTSEEGRKKKSKPAQTAAAFAEFWRAYPRRVAREAAHRAFARAVERGTDPAVLITGAQRYAVERAGQEPKYTKHPATWLNAGCWSDEPAGDVVIDEAGNVIAYEPPRQQQTGRGFATIAEELDAELAATGREWF